MPIDWSRAPEGATHANPNDTWCIWRKVAADKSFWWSVIDSEWIELHPMAYRIAKHDYVEREAGVCGS